MKTQARGKQHNKRTTALRIIHTSTFIEHNEVSTRREQA